MKEVIKIVTLNAESCMYNAERMVVQEVETKMNLHFKHKRMYIHHENNMN